MMPFGNHDFRQLSRNGTLPVSCIRSVAMPRAQSSAVHLFLLEMEQLRRLESNSPQRQLIGRSGKSLYLQIGYAKSAVSPRSGRSLTQNSHVWVRAKVREIRKHLFDLTIRESELARKRASILFNRSCRDQPACSHIICLV
jgi:hypothetical protein